MFFALLFLSEFFCSSFFPLWFCSSPFSPKLHSFLEAFILPFFFSYRFWVKMKNAPLKGAGCMKSFHFAIGLTLWLSDIPLYSTWGNRKQKFCLPLLRTIYFGRHISKFLLAIIADRVFSHWHIRASIALSLYTWIIHNKFLLVLYWTSVALLLDAPKNARRVNKWRVFLITAPWDCPCAYIW